MKELGWEQVVAPPVRIVPRGRLHARVPVPICRSPESRESVATLHNALIADWPLWVPMVDAQPGWALVWLPSKPPGIFGWVCLDERVVVAPQRAHLVVDTGRGTVSLVEPGRRSTWPAHDATQQSRAPRGRSFVLGDTSVSIDAVRHRVLFAAPVDAWVDDGYAELVGLHSPAVSLQGTGVPGHSVLVSHDAMTDLVVAAPAGTIVFIL